VPSLRSLAVFLLLVVMELLAGFSLLVGSGLIVALRVGDGLIWLLLLAGIGGLATGLGIALIGPAEPWNRILLLVGGGVWAAIPAVLTGRDLPVIALTLALLTVAYWRGLRLSLEPADSETVKREFGFGFGLLFLSFLWGISRDVNHEEPFWSALALIGIAYTLTAMIALVVARLERQRERGAGVAVLAAVAVQLGLLVLLAIGLIALFGHDIAGAVGNATQPARNAIGSALYHVVLLLAGPIQWLIDLVRSHAHNVRPRTPQPPVTGSRFTGKRPHIGHADQTILKLLGLLALAALLGVVAHVVWRLLPRIPRYRAPRGYREERRALLTPAEIARAVLGWLLSLLRKSGEGMAQAVLRTRRRIWGDYPEDPVRRVYTQVLRRAAAAGQPRPLAATPDEFGRSLASRWPDAAFDLGAITEAYVLRRYGEAAPQAGALERLGVHWQRVRSAIRVPRAGLGPHPAHPETPSAGTSTEARTQPASMRERVGRALAGLNDPSGGGWGTLLVWIACLLIPFVLAILLILTLFLVRL
jgi:hypothetical protein